MECPACRESLTKADKRSGPDEPEVGWEYYECPACGETSHPARVEPTSTTKSRAKRRMRFTGTVVKVNTPPVLDNGEETVDTERNAENDEIAGRSPSIPDRARYQPQWGRNETERSGPVWAPVS